MPLCGPFILENSNRCSALLYGQICLENPEVNDIKGFFKH